MSNTSMGGIPSLTVDKSIDLLKTMYVNAIKNNVDLHKLPSVMLWGQMGIGKSQSIRSLAKIIESETNKRVNVIDVRLILFNPVDLRGIPTANNDKTKAVWLRPDIFDMDNSNDVINILFLDEISAASPQVQAAAYQITLDRKIGEHKLPDNCIVIAAGNRITDKSVAYQMPKALANRLLHIEITDGFESWNRWAIENNINPMILGFLKFRPNYLNSFDPQTSGLAFSTPRSWEMASNILNYISGDVKEVFNLIAGLVGSGIATEFKAWVKVFKDLPNIDDIFNGKEVDVPKNPDTIYALTSSMVHYAKKYKDDMDKITNSIKYALKLTPDYSLILLKDYQYIDNDYKIKLLRIPEYSNWLKTRGRLLDEAR